MNILNKIISYCGSDRIMHFLVGALIVAQFEFVYLDFAYGPLIGVATVMFLAFAKEVWLDDKADWVDYWFSVIGAMTEVILLIARSNIFYIPW